MPSGGDFLGMDVWQENQLKQPLDGGWDSRDRYFLSSQSIANRSLSISTSERGELDAV